MTHLLSQLSLLGVGGAILPPRPLPRIPKVSVVIPCYNYGRFLAQCIASLANQPDIELDIIIVDDCSTDGSLFIAEGIARSDDRIRVIAHRENKGHIATYNDGLAAAKGEFVVLLSADDLVTPGALSRSAALLVAHENVGFVYGNAVHFFAEPPPCRTDPNHWIVWKGSDWLQARCRSGYNVIASPEVMMRRSVLEKIGPYKPDLPHAGDFEMWLRASAVADVGFVAGADQAFYRHHTANMNTTMFSSGTDLGRFIDLEQRLASFVSVFSDVAGMRPDSARLFAMARRTIACQAMHAANYAYARGKRDFPYARYLDFAERTFPEVRSLPVGKAHERRKRWGMWPRLPLHPLWAHTAVTWRLVEMMRRWRRYRVGV